MAVVTKPSLPRQSKEPLTEERVSFVGDGTGHVHDGLTGDGLGGSKVTHSNLLSLGVDDHLQYHTDARALTWLGTRSTTDLPEGTRLYYTDARARAAISATSPITYNSATGAIGFDLTVTDARYVNVTGDTMTGNLLINKDDPYLELWDSSQGPSAHAWRITNTGSLLIQPFDDAGALSNAGFSLGRGGVVGAVGPFNLDFGLRVGGSFQAADLGWYNSAGLNTSGSGVLFYFAGWTAPIGAGRALIGIRDHRTAAAGVGGGIVFSGSVLGEGSSATIDDFAIIQGIRETTSGNASALIFLTRINGGALTEQMRIGSAGLVTLTSLTASRALVTDASKGLVSSAATATEVGYLSGVTSAIQTQINGRQPLDGDLTAIAGLASTGLIARTATDAAATRTLTAGAGVTVTNGDGVAGNPSIAIGQAVGTADSPTFTNLSLSSASNPQLTLVSGANTWLLFHRSSSSNQLQFTYNGITRFDLDVSGNLSGLASLTATNLVGTLSTAAQPNVTSVGNLTALTLSATVGSRVNLFGGSNYGIGIQSNLLQIYVPTTTERIGLGHGSSGAFTETLSVVNNQVGIGTTAPVAGSKAQIVGDAVALTLTRTGANLGGLLAFTDQINAIKARVGVEISNNNFIIDNGSTTFLTILNASGKTGIGATAPQQKLSVAGSLSVFGGTEMSYSPTTTDILASHTTANSRMLVAQGLSNYGGLIWNYNATAANAYLGIGTNGNNHMVINQSGNVGIGTTNPQQLLDLYTATSAVRSIGFTYSAADAAGPFLNLIKARASNGTVLTGDQLGLIVFGGYDTSATPTAINGASIMGVVNGTVGAGIVPTDLVFNTGSSGAGTERMRLRSTGSVWIGTTSVDVGANNLGVQGIIRTDGNQIRGSSATGNLRFRSLQLSATVGSTAALLHTADGAGTLGIVYIIDQQDNAIGVFHLRGTSHVVSLLHNTPGDFNTTPGLGTGVNVYWSTANLQYEIENRRGAIRNFDILYFVQG